MRYQDVFQWSSLTGRNSAVRKFLLKQVLKGLVSVFIFIKKLPAFSLQSLFLIFANYTAQSSQKMCSVCIMSNANPILLQKLLNPWKISCLLANITLYSAMHKVQNTKKNLQNLISNEFYISYKENKAMEILLYVINMIL